MTRGRVADRYGAGGADGAYSDEHAGPRLRSVHPRPYMPAFRAYLFAPSTRPWLDVMVWSSAQPHSVADMVDHCFGERKTELRAVWARDTLGLSKDNYSEDTFLCHCVFHFSSASDWGRVGVKGCAARTCSQIERSTHSHLGTDGLSLLTAPCSCHALFPACIYLFAISRCSRVV